MTPKRWKPLVKAVATLPLKGVECYGYALAKSIHSTDEIWHNDLYTVTVRRGVPCPGWGMQTVTHLSIRNNDRSDRHNWREFQFIKNQLVGPENQAVEIYPQERYLVDTANQYHLWVFEDPKTVMPFGFFYRMVTESEVGGSVQAEWPENMKPPDMMGDEALSQLIQTARKQAEGGRK